MTEQPPFELFLVAPPGLEPVLCAEAQEKGFAEPRAVTGGVITTGDWAEVWRANLVLRGAARVLVRIAVFRVNHLAQLDKRARKLDWDSILRPDVPVRVEATCKRSRIYHSGAAAQRIATAVHDTLGAPVAQDAVLVIKARIENDLCTISLDTTGEPLHKRGFKAAVNKAPMRENLAALILRACGYDGSEPLLDPMCGSGTFVIEAAEIAAALQPGRARAFAFEHLAAFDPVAWQAVRNQGERRDPAGPFIGSDRDAGAIRMSGENAQRAGVAEVCRFTQQSVSALERPDCAPGLVIFNPPYGARIGNKNQLTSLYRALGQALKTRFSGWRVGFVTSEESLARATGLPLLEPSPSIDNNGTRIRLYRTEALG